MSDDDNIERRDCAGIKPHPLRFDVNNELHARPFERLVAPKNATMYAMFHDEQASGAEYDHLVSLCKRYGLHPPMKGTNHFSADFGNYRLRWERHAEFTTYIFFRPAKGETPFSKSACAEVPEDWLAALPGLLLVAVKIDMLDKDQPAPTEEELDGYFISDSLIGSEIGGKAGHIWTDLRMDKDGYNRSLVHNHNMPSRKAGRVVLRLFEIAVYRALALLALPLAREVGQKVAQINQELSDLTEQLSLTGDAKADAALLRDLIRVSAEIEKLSSRTAYRFSATRAYFPIIQSRIAELKEVQVAPYQTLGEFLDRRLTPAIRTCNSTADRLADLSRRATRTANLLRTKTDFALSEQNQAQLSAMNKRAQRQLRLQETVEGLSIAAISYYLVSLIGYGLDAGENLGLPLDSDVIKAASIPVMLVAVWALLRRVKKRLLRNV